MHARQLILPCDPRSPMAPQLPKSWVEADVVNRLCPSGYIPVGGCSVENIREYLFSRAVDQFIFVEHGDADLPDARVSDAALPNSTLIFTLADGSVERLSPSVLVELLSSCSKTLELVYLSGCRTLELGLKICEEANVPCVVCWETSMLDNVGPLFSEGFFEAVSAGHSYQAAFDRAKLRVTTAMIEGEHGAVPRYVLCDPEAQADVDARPRHAGAPRLLFSPRLQASREGRESLGRGRGLVAAPQQRPADLRAAAGPAGDGDSVFILCCSPSDRSLLERELALVAPQPQPQGQGQPQAQGQGQGQAAPQQGHGRVSLEPARGQARHEHEHDGLELELGAQPLAESAERLARSLAQRAAREARVLHLSGTIRTVLGGVREPGREGEGRQPRSALEGLARSVAALGRQRGGRLECAVLNACDSLALGELLACEEVAFVVCWKADVTDAGAALFARGFYAEYAKRAGRVLHPYEMCFEAGRRLLLAEGFAAAGVPLLLRAQSRTSEDLARPGPGPGLSPTQAGPQLSPPASSHASGASGSHAEYSHAESSHADCSYGESSPQEQSPTEGEAGLQAGLQALGLQPGPGGEPAHPPVGPRAAQGAPTPTPGPDEASVAACMAEARSWAQAEVQRRAMAGAPAAEAGLAPEVLTGAMVEARRRAAAEAEAMQAQRRAGADVRRAARLLAEAQARGSAEAEVEAAQVQRRATAEARREARMQAEAQRLAPWRSFN